MSNLKCVLWSGGCDSTLAYFDLLRNQKTWFVEGHPRGEVRSIAIDCPQLNAGLEARGARTALIEAFRAQGLIVRHTEILLSSTHDGVHQSAQGADIHSQMWTSIAPMYLQETEDLVLGWVLGEDANLPEVRAVFEANQRLNRKTGELDLPLRWTPKALVIQRLQAAKLLRKTWWCEGCEPDCGCPGFRRPALHKACKRCAKCIKHATALWQLSMWTPEQLEAL